MGTALLPLIFRSWSKSDRPSPSLSINISRYWDRYYGSRSDLSQLVTIPRCLQKAEEEMTSTPANYQDISIAKTSTDAHVNTSMNNLVKAWGVAERLKLRALNKSMVLILDGWEFEMGWCSLSCGSLFLGCLNWPLAGSYWRFPCARQVNRTPRWCRQGGDTLHKSDHARTPLFSIKPSRWNQWRIVLWNTRIFL